MTYTAKNVSKGGSVSIGGAGIFVGIAGLTEIDVSDLQSLTTDGTALDSGTFELNDPTGYSKPPSIKTTGFHDHSVYATITALIANPSPTAVAVSFPLGGSSAVDTFLGTGFKLGRKMGVGKLQMADLEIVTTGAPA